MSDEVELSQPHLLTTREAAEILRVSPSTVLNWIGKDKIPYITLPGSKGGRREYRISKQRLLSSLAANYDLGQEFSEADAAVNGPDAAVNGLHKAGAVEQVEADGGVQARENGL